MCPFLKAFEELEDPRIRNCPHPLNELLLVALGVVTSGADDWVSVVKWVRLKVDWLQRFLPFDNGIASHDRFSRVFSLLKAKGFKANFLCWMQQLCPSLAGQVIPLDGKSLCGSHDTGANMTHLVSALHSGAGLVLGQVRTAVKSNEITAVLQLLDALDVKGVTITIDAMGCQHEIVRKIVHKQAHYIVAVKNNPPSLASAVESLFEATDGGVHEGPLQQDITLDKDHSQLETRRCVDAHDLCPIDQQAQAWPGLKSVVMIESKREFINGRDKGKSSTEWRYYISSLQLEAAEFNRQVRAHLAIDKLSLDNRYAFAEDDCRIRVGDGTQNFAILRRIAVNLIKQEKSTETSFNIKRRQAGWSTDYLETLLGLPPR